MPAAHTEAGLNCADWRQNAERVAADVACNDFIV